MHQEFGTTRPLLYAWAAILGMGECKSSPTTEVKLLRLSSVKSALAASSCCEPKTTFCVLKLGSLSSINPRRGRSSAASLSCHIFGTLAVAVRQHRIRDSDGSKNIRRRHLQPHPQVHRRKVWRAGAATILAYFYYCVPCSRTPPTIPFELTRLMSNILASYYCKQKNGSPTPRQDL